MSRFHLREKIAAVTLLFSLAAFAEVEPVPKLHAGRVGAHAHIPKPSAAVETLTPPPEAVSIPTMTADELPATTPRVTYSGGRLTIDAANAMLIDILNAIQAKTGAVIDTPRDGSNERVAVHLSGPPNLVIPALLDGSTFGYVIRASTGDPEGVQEVVLTKRSLSTTQGSAQNSATSEQPVVTRPFGSARPALMSNRIADNQSTDNTPNRTSAMLEQTAPVQVTAQQILATDEFDKPEDKSDPQAQPIPQTLAAAVIDPHPTPPVQLTADQQNAELVKQQRDTNRQFMQDLYSSRQKLQPQPPAQQDQQPQ